MIYLAEFHLRDIEDKLVTIVVNNVLTITKASRGVGTMIGFIGDETEYVIVSESYDTVIGIIESTVRRENHG